MKLNIEIPRNVLDKLEEELEGVKKPEAAVKTAVNAAAKTIQKTFPRRQLRNTVIRAEKRLLWRHQKSIKQRQKKRKPKLYSAER